MALTNWTYTVTNTADDSAIASVNIWATSDRAGNTVLDTGTTNASGAVVLSLEADSDVYLWHSLNGYLFENPNLQTVTGSGTGEGTAIVDAVPDAVVQSVTVRNLIEDAFQEMGILAAGEDVQSDDATLALRRLNMLIDSWKLVQSLSYTIDIERYTLTADKGSYTIGPSGDFLTERPVRISKANIIVTDTSPEVRYALNIMERAEEWGHISAPLQYAPIPSHLYCDYAYPDATIYLYYGPSIAYDLELFTWNQLSQFKTTTEVVILPPGYYEAIMLSLAEKMCAAYGVPMDTRQMITADAAKARAKVRAVNKRPAVISTHDCGMPSVE